MYKHIKRIISNIQIWNKINNCGNEQFDWRWMRSSAPCILSRLHLQSRWFSGVSTREMMYRGSPGIDAAFEPTLIVRCSYTAIDNCHQLNLYTYCLTHWGPVMLICVGNLAIIGSDNGLSPARRQAIIWTKAVILLIGPLGMNFSEILIGIQTSSFTIMHLKMSSAKRRPFCLGPNVLRD